MSKIVYVGPTIPGVANRNTFYDDTPSEPLQAAVRETPFLGNLIVPISGLSDALTQIRTQKGAIYTIYKKALDHYSA